MKKRKRACIYCRVGDPRNDHFIYPMTQELRSFCADEGLEVAMEFADCCRGTTLRREGLQGLLAQAACNKFDVVVVKKHSALARKISDLLYVIEELERFGIEVITVNGHGLISQAVVKEILHVIDNPIITELDLKE